MRLPASSSHRAPPPPPAEGETACKGVSPQRSRGTHDTSGLCASRTPPPAPTRAGHSQRATECGSGPGPSQQAMGAESQSTAASASSEGSASATAAPRYVKRMVDAAGSHVKRPPPPPPDSRGSFSTSCSCPCGSGGSAFPVQQRGPSAEARTREVLRSGKANARTRARQTAQGGDAEGPPSGEADS